MLMIILTFMVQCQDCFSAASGSREQTGSRGYISSSTVNDYSTIHHGPVIDNQELPRDLHEPYPGKLFGPMGPIDKSSFANDVSLRSLSSENSDTASLSGIQGAHHGDNHQPVSLREYSVFTVEFHRVETPFIIGIWIFFASIAKIGKAIIIRHYYNGLDASLVSGTFAHTCFQCKRYTDYGTHVSRK